MTREELENSANWLYTNDEMKILLRGFDIGAANAKELTDKDIQSKQNKGYIQLRLMRNELTGDFGTISGKICSTRKEAEAELPDDCVVAEIRWDPKDLENVGCYKWWSGPEYPAFNAIAKTESLSEYSSEYIPEIF